MSWPQTAAITGITLATGRGVIPQIQGLERWPDFTPAGWTGPLRYTLWAGFSIGGTWVLSGFLQFWAGRTDSGANPLEQAADGPQKGTNNWQANWAYNGSWSPLNAHVPQPGELMAFMVTAGDARNNGQQTVRERSQIVTLPLAIEGSWPFIAAPAPDPTPTPAPTPEPTHQPPVPAPAPSGTVVLNSGQYAAIMQRFDNLDKALAQARADVKSAGASILSQLPALLAGGLFTKK